MSGDFWILDEVKGDLRDCCYPFCVAGRYRERLTDGSTQFFWKVPNLWEGYDFSECKLIDNAALEAAGLGAVKVRAA